MATIDRTINGGGTVGHPSRMPTPYVITSQVHDTADGVQVEMSSNWSMSLQIP